MTIQEIKERTKETSPYFFSPETLKFFGQKLSDFTVKKLNEHEYHIYAPSFWDGDLVGYTERIFDTRDNTLR